jgi:hypothetical protein
MYSARDDGRTAGELFVLSRYFRLSVGMDLDVLDPSWGRRTLVVA